MEENKEYEEWSARTYKELMNAYTKTARKGGEVLAISGKIRQMNEDEGMLRTAFEAGEVFILQNLFTEEKIQQFASLLSFGRAYMPQLFDKDNKTSKTEKTPKRQQPTNDIKNWRYICRNCGWNIPSMIGQPDVTELFCAKCDKWRKFDRLAAPKS